MKQHNVDVHNEHIFANRKNRMPYQCSTCEKAFLHEDSLKEHNTDVHERKKIQMLKGKKSRKKKKHMKDENVAEVEKNISVEYCGLTFHTVPYHNAVEKSGKKNKPDISSVKTFKGSSLDKIKGYGC